MSRIVQKGATNITDYIFLQDNTSGSPETGVTVTILNMQYVRAGKAPAAKVDASALASAGAAHTDNNIVEVDATDQPGLYRVDWPDAAFVSSAGVDQVICTVKGSAGSFHPAHREFQLTDWNPNSTTFDECASATSSLGIAKEATVSGLNNLSGASAFAICGSAVSATTVAKVANITALNDLSSGSAFTVCASAASSVMRGTDNAALNATVALDATVAKEATIAALNDLSSGSAFTVCASAASSVMRGTDSAALAATVALDATVAKEATVSALNDLSAGSAFTVCASATSSLSFAKEATVSGLNNLSGGSAFTNVLRTQLTEAYAANGVSPTLEQGVFAIHQFLQGFAIGSTSYVVRKLDGSTTAFTATLDDAATPTSMTRA